jgi:hypothetical protein
LVRWIEGSGYGLVVQKEFRAKFERLGTLEWERGKVR